MPYLNIPESTLAAGVTLIIAKLTAELKIKVSQQLEQLQKDVLDSCGNQRKLQNLRRKLNGIKKFTISSKGRVAKINKITAPLQKLATTLNVSIFVLQNLPIPNTGTTVGATNRFSNALFKARELSKQISDTVLTVNTAVAGAAGFISILAKVETLIDKIDRQIKVCLEEGTPPEEQDTPTQTEEDNNYTGPDGTPYRLEIKLIDKTGVAPLRRAIAIDPRGITRYQSDDSYSSSTDVLLDEVKFRIDNNIRV
jgi:hypothetical protein